MEVLLYVSDCHPCGLCVGWRSCLSNPGLEHSRGSFSLSVNSFPIVARADK